MIFEHNAPRPTIHLLQDSLALGQGSWQLSYPDVEHYRPRSLVQSISEQLGTGLPLSPNR